MNNNSAEIYNTWKLSSVFCLVDWGLYCILYDRVVYSVHVDLFSDIYF